jgi:outer membrane protein assembly factor BamB
MSASLAAPAAADWPVYGHDLGNSRSAGADGPSAAEARTMQRAWTFNSQHGDFTGTPVVAGGTLVAGTNLGSIYALDATTGGLRWSRNVGNGHGRAFITTPPSCPSTHEWISHIAYSTADDGSYRAASATPCRTRRR